jgi:cell division septal protein FtsQ
MVKIMQSENIKKKKFNVRKFIILLLIVYLVAMIIYYFFTLPVKNVIITGNSLVTDEEIIKSSNITNNSKLITLNSNTVTNKIKKLSLIDDVVVKKYINGSIYIDVSETKVLFYNTLNKAYVLANESEVDDINVLGIPLLNNYVPKDIYQNLIKKMSKIDDDTISLISEIEYDPDIKNDITIDENRFLLRMNDGNIVYINLANFDKLNKYKAIYTYLGDTKGTLKLDSIRDKVLFEAFKEGEESEGVSTEVELPEEVG